MDGKALLKIFSIRLVALTAVASAVAAAPASTPADWIETIKSTYLLLPPTVLSDKPIQGTAWSSDGSYFAVAVTDRRSGIDQILAPRPQRFEYSPGGADLITYDCATGRVKQVWSSDDPRVRVVNLTWLHGSTTLLVQLCQSTKPGTNDPEVYGLMAVDAQSGRSEWIPGLEQLGEMVNVNPSPTKAIALVSFDVSPPTTQLAQFHPYNAFWNIGPGGQVLRRIRFDSGWNAEIKWGADGTNWYVWSENRKTKEVRTREMQPDGTFKVTHAPLYSPPAPVTPEFVTQSRPMTAQQRKARRKFLNLWLSSSVATDHPDVLITASGEFPDLSPANNGVFYVEGGVAKLRPIVKLTDDQKVALLAAVRADLISNAKQVALGILMYSNDFDDTFPGGDNLSDKLDPYLKNPSLMDGFMYTPPSDLSMGNLTSPATTQLGYYDGPGGRAVAYTDGHVQWIPNP